MEKRHRVQIIAVPVACTEGVKNTWRDVAEWANIQLRSRFGDTVSTEYFDLFDQGCPAIPPDAQLPMVLVDGQLLSSGGKISIPAIRKKLTELSSENQS
jgi:hypothetical protein